LEQAVAEALAQIKIISGEVECVETRIKDFLDEYYGEVGKYFGDLEDVNQAIDRIQKDANNLNHKKNSTDELEDNEGYEVYVRHGAIKNKEAKRLFRKLAKAVHPDTSDLPNAKEVFSEASSAYERQDLCGLILLEQQIMESRDFDKEEPIKKLERLEEKYTLAVSEYKSLLKKKEELKYSASYQLWKRVFKERAKGRDVVREVKLNVMQEINAKRKILAKKKQEKELIFN
jgi:hypothetical protein